MSRKTDKLGDVSDDLAYQPTASGAANSQRCPSEEQIVAFVEGALLDSVRSELERHLDRCRACGAVMAELVSMSDTVGAALAPATLGRYQLRTVIGKGGMGEVWSAWDPQLMRKVAIKRLRPDGIDSKGRARLVQEARALAAVSHPNVVAVFDAGEDNGEVYIATELVDGAALSSWQRGRPWRQVVAAWAQAARGLVAVHQCGIIHRDVKAANVLVGLDERVRIGDFGIARAEFAEPSEPGNTLSRTGWVAGTPGYMAPEQLQGGPVDARVDQFALCVALGEALLGRKPVTGEQIEFAESPRLAQLIARGLAPLASRRFATMAELAGELEAIAAALVQAPLVSTTPDARTLSSKNVAFISIVGAAMLGGGAIAVIVMQRSQAAATAPQADATLRTAALLTAMSVDAPRAMIADVGGIDALGAAIAPSDQASFRPPAQNRTLRNGATGPAAGPLPALGSANTATTLATVSTAATATPGTAINVVAIEYASLADDPDGVTARKRRDAGDAAGCLRIVGNEPAGATPRNAVRAVCMMLNGQCEAGAARLRAMAALSVPPMPPSATDTWIDDHLTRFCPVWDPAASLGTRLNRLAMQAQLAHSLFDGARFRQTLYAVSTVAVVGDAKLRVLLFRAYIEQLHRYASRLQCDKVDEVVDAADKIGLKIDSAEFLPWAACGSLARLYAVPPP